MNRRQSLHFTALVLAGCIPEPNTRERLIAADIIGTYRLTPDSLRLISAGNFRPDPAQQYTLTLHADGTCSFASVLVEFETGNYTVAEGHWHLEHDTKGGSWYHKPNALRLELQIDGRTYGFYFNFSGTRNALRLWNYYGDPDEFRLIEYTKVN